jgi:hypothetical protein
VLDILNVTSFNGGHTGATMLTKFMVLLVAGAALTGCCASGTGCATPTAGAPIAWDGLGEAPTANDDRARNNGRQSERQPAIARSFSAR